jgi:hypothetical protein
VPETSVGGRGNGDLLTAAVGASGAIGLGRVKRVADGGHLPPEGVEGVLAEDAEAAVELGPAHRRRDG